MHTVLLDTERLDCKELLDSGNSLELLFESRNSILKFFNNSQSGSLINQLLSY